MRNSDENKSISVPEESEFSAFTELNYRRLLEIARRSYRFVAFGEQKQGERVLYWRHDVDMSPHRALALAHTEQEAGVKATYFWHLHSEFYNLLEAPITKIVGEIMAMGHYVGLHFDPSYCSLRGLWNIQEELHKEASLLRAISGAPVRVFSFHNPTAAILSTYQEEAYAGLINTYSSGFRDKVGYCSDSNGYWRHERLEDVLENRKHDVLQVLTHPVWWQKEPMSPRARIQRCIDGRAKSTGRVYDELLKKHARVNVD